MRPIALILAGLAAQLAATAGAAAAPACTLDADVDFSLADPTSGAAMTAAGQATLSCAGGSPGAAYALCMLPLSRPLQLDGPSAVAFDVFHDPARSERLGGALNEPPLLRFEINAQGTARATVPLYAEITTAPEEVAAGSYAASLALPWALAEAGPCGAASQGLGQIRAKAHVPKRCSVYVRSDLDFGVLNPASRPWTARGALDVTCTRGVAYGITIGPGAAGAGLRVMRKGADILPYGLYVDAGHSQSWGAGIVKGGNGTGRAERHTVFGAILVHDLPRAGEYTDEVVVTVTY